MAAAEEDVGSFDMEAFIDEIRGLPCIWDYTSEAHNNRLEKARAWEGLCQRFCDGYDAMDKKEKAEWVTKLQRKWRSLRDSYNRELKKQNSGVPKHRQYLYFTNLHFLRPLAERRNAENFIGDFDEDEATTHSTDEGGVGRAPKRKRPNPHHHQQQDDPGKLHHYLAEFGPKVDMTTVDPNSDGDWHFLVSLYEHFKGIDGRSKLVAKIEILNVIHKYTKPQTWGYAAGGQYGNHAGGYAAVTAYGGGARQNAAAARPSRSSSPSGSESE